ncbi:MerR family transcriptional regulator [Bifidobacterium sp.]|uniref:MerR family transcriptional regulator n=1 Tax=Bifidobacterium sp. TaxID=41200 RepID=UPI0039E95B6F
MEDSNEKSQDRLLGESDGVPSEWMQPQYSIGRAAERTGVPADTLRYYEREGIMAPAGRTSGGSRRYSELDLEKIACAHWLREAGVPIAVIKHFDALRDQGRETVSARRSLLIAHRDELQRRRDRIEASMAAIEEKIAKYDRIMEARR